MQLGVILDSGVVRLPETSLNTGMKTEKRANLRGFLVVSH